MPFARCWEWARGSLNLDILDCVTGSGAPLAEDLGGSKGFKSGM